ncbi:hypothetical protein B0H19DRAFT_968072 [Mycena capillaripes]|nr:hypothetical protein B0H19DRAFT_968072 [Mycena capillaripes]
MEIDAEAQPERAEGLWFADGSVVVKAQNSLFRVFGGILAQASPIFADMFDIPQPQNAETMDGRPVVEMLDSVADVTFRAIFDSSFFEAYPAPATYETMAGILRLSTKYEVEHLRRRALVHLSSAFPMTLADWDMRTPRSWNFQYSSSGSISLINLCRQTEALWILPAAFYRLGMTSRASTIICGGVSQVQLSVSDRVCFLDGLLVQRSATMDIVRFLYHPVSTDGCMTRKRCAEAKLDALEQVRDDLKAFPALPLGIWCEDYWDRLSEMCATCLEELREIHRKAREEFWRQIPEMFKLPSWHELEDLKFSAIGGD